MPAESDAQRNLNAQGLATRKLLLDTAGRLFALRGYSGTYLRDLASESGVGLSSIIYHFQSKHNLYLETIRHFVIDTADLNRLFEPLRHLNYDDPQAIADTFRDITRMFLEVCHGPNHTPYVTELYARIMVGSDQEALGMLLTCFVEVQQLLPAVIGRIRPDWDARQVGFWMQLFWSQLQYTVMGKRLVLFDMQLGESFPPEFLDESAWQFTRNCMLPLGLPEPTRNAEKQ